MEVSKITLLWPKTTKKIENFNNFTKNITVLY